MRRVITAVSMLAVILFMSVPVKAESIAFISAFPGLNYNGTTATCSLEVYAGHSTDSIEATVTLKCGSTTIAQWNNLTANGYMNFSDTATVSHGLSYTMHVTLKVNGQSYNVSDITKICP